MSAFSHTDWTVMCDGTDCSASLRTDELDGRAGGLDPKAADVRRFLKRRGWAVAVPTGRERRADYCPEHKEEAQR